jgi:hypothetical protein
MSLAGGKAALAESTKEILARWQQTRETWRDLKAAEFEEAWLAELPDRVAAALRVIEELDQLLARIHADCE